ncbi:MAG: FAD-dependent oxidoreductase [Planctomycetales bacterium]|nr:FAD-dependent oxidoreductase [Planctomycetales bacterium]
MRIAVVGAGVGGLVAARLLATRHEVALLEAADSLGGHANTVQFAAYGRQFAADTGFMVFNDRTYPQFTRLLELLGVDAQDSDMSFAVRCDADNVEYQGSSLAGLFAQRRNLIRPQFWRMLADIVRFNREAPRDFATSSPREGRAGVAETQPTGHVDISLRRYVARNGYSDAFWRHYLLPMTAAIWSAPADAVAEFPAAFLIRFFQNHGLLELRNRPQWKTIPGGSCRYVTAIAKDLAECADVRLNTPVQRVERIDGGVMVSTSDESAEMFDAVVLATHAPRTLAMLADATDAERFALSAFPYQSNRAVLHTDPSLLPRRRAAWASWNYLVPDRPDSPVAVTYELNRLQRLGAPGPICVTLNPPQEIAPEHAIAEFAYDHPLFTPRSIAAQAMHEQLHEDGRVLFCGAYWGNGFHEDGVNSALTACRRLGAGMEDLETLRPPRCAGDLLPSS